MMKTLLLTSVFSLFAMAEANASAFVGFQVQKEGGELEIIHKKTKAAFIERGGKNYWHSTYRAEPGAYTIIGKNPGRPAVAQSASFDEGKSYHLVLTAEGKIELFQQPIDKSEKPSK